MKIVGFDFGTTNSLLSAIHGDAAIHYLDRDQRPFPSVVCYEGGKRIVGREAKERLSQAGLGIHGNIVRSPKTLLVRESVFIEGTERNPIDIVADVIRHVVSRAKEGARGRDLGDIKGAVVTIPVNMEGYRRRALREAFKIAGLRIVQFVHEPLAALYGHFRKAGLGASLDEYEGKLALVFDWGGGTLDLTLCRVVDGMAVQLLNDGTAEVGGDVFDEAIMNRLVQKLCRQRGLGEEVEAHPGARARLLDRCERAKIDLSTRETAHVYVGSFFRGLSEDDFDHALTRLELEEIVQPLLDKGFRRIENLLQQAGFGQEQVRLCLATGGMANMPVVKRRLHEWFGPERVRIPEGTATMIAEGAAWIAEDEAGLRLAKNIELTLARGSHLPLVKAGTPMPKEGEVHQQPFHLYCADPRDGVAKFEICAPLRPGAKILPTEPRAHLENATVKVHSGAKPFHERLELDVRLDDDLVLTVQARSLMARDKDEREIHNLEFGLAFPARAEGSGGGGTDEGKKPRRIAARTGGLAVRSNVTATHDLRMVPGELLYELDPAYFDVRRNPPREQDEERLYYRPCARCGRDANDPLCACSGPSTAGRTVPQAEGAAPG